MCLFVCRPGGSRHAGPHGGRHPTTEVRLVLPKYVLRALQRPSLRDEGLVLSVRTHIWDLPKGSERSDEFLGHHTLYTNIRQYGAYIQVRIVLRLVTPFVLRLPSYTATAPQHHCTPAPTAATTEVGLAGSKVVASMNALSTACHAHRARACCERRCGEWIFGAGSHAERWFEARPERTVGATEGSDLLQGGSPAKNVPRRYPSTAEEKSATACGPSWI